MKLQTSRFKNSAVPVLLNLLFVLFLICGCNKPSERDVLCVGMELNYPPFEMVDNAGKPTGIDVEMAEALGKFLNRPVSIENIPFDGLIPALKTEKIDLIISSMTRTPERAQSIDFSEPYLKTGLGLLLNRAAANLSPEALDASDKTVAVRQGTTGMYYAREHFSRARLLVLDKEDACVLEVVQGKAHAFVYDQMSVYKQWLKHQDSTVARLQPLREESWAIGIRKGRPELVQKVNAFIEDFRNQGGFGRLGDKYLKDEKEAFRQQGIAFIF